MVIDGLKYNGLCSCGREHKMETAFSVIESGCLKNIRRYMSKYNLQSYTVAVYDENTYKATVDRQPDFAEWQNHRRGNPCIDLRPHPSSPFGLGDSFRLNSAK